MATTIESLVGQLGYDYDKSGLNAAIKDQHSFRDATSDVTAGMADSGRQGGALGGVLGGMGKHKAGMLAVAGGAAALGLGIISATGSARNYESALASIDTLGPQVAAHHAEFKDQILDVSTAMGQDLVGSTNAVYDALSSGVPPDNVIDFMSTASKAAVAGATDTGTSVRALTATLNAWKLNAAEAGNVSDVFFTGVNVGVFRFEDLANSIGQVAPLAASLGVTYQEVTAATATLTKSGLTASQAITQQRASMVSLITPNREMSGVLKQLALDNEEVARTAEEQGISIGEAALRTLGYQGAMVAVRDSAKNADIELAKAAGSVESLGAFLGLSGENAAGAAADLDLMGSSAGASQAAFDTMAETTDAKMAKFRSAWEAAKVSVGDVFLPVLASLAEAGAPVLNFLADGVRMLQPLAAGFDALPQPIKFVGAALAALTAGGVGLAGGAIYIGGWVKNLKELAPLAAQAKGGLGGMLSVLTGVGTAAGTAGGPLGILLDRLPKVGSLSTLASGGLAKLSGDLPSLGSMATAAGGGLSSLVGSAGSALAALGPVGIALAAVAAAGALAYKAVGAANSALDEQFAAAQQGGGALSSYVSAAQKARDEAGLMGKAGFLLKDVWHGLTDVWHNVVAAMQPVGEWFSVISDKAAGLIQSVTGISGGLMGLGGSLLKMIPGVGALSMIGDALRDQNGPVREATVAWLEMEKGIDPAILKTSEFATAQAELGAQLDDGSLSQEEYSQRLLGVASELAGVQAAGASAAEGIASTGDALSQASAGAAEAVGGFQQYSDALIGMVGGAAIGFDPKAEAPDEDRQKELDKANQAQAEAQAQHFGAMMQSRREFNAQHAALLAEGKTAEAATLAEQYASEQSMQVEHLAQLAINHVNAMLQMNNISEQQAQLIYGSIASAFPGAEIFDGSTAAMMEFSSVMGQALAGNEEAALRLGGVIASTPERLTEGQAAVDSYAALSIQRYEEARAAAEAHATGISDAGAIVSAGVTSAADATGAATALMVQSYASSQSAAGNHAAVTEADAARVRGALTTTADVGDASSGRMEQAYERSGVAATEHAESTSAAGADAAGSVETMAGGIGTSLQSAGTEFKKAGQTASGAGTQIRGAFGGLGQQIEGDARRGTTALGELGTKQQEVVQQSRNLGAASQEGFGAGAGAAQQAARGIASSADDIGGALVEAGEGSVRLGDELAELPDRVEIEIEVIGMAQIFADLRRLNGTINDIRSNARRPFPIGTGDSGDNRGGGGGAPPRGGGPQSVLPPSSTFSAPPAWMDDLRNMADVGITVNASLNDESGGALLSATGGDLLYKRYLDGLAAADYDVTVNADLDETDILGQIDAAMQAAAGLLDILEEQHEVFLRGTAAEEGSLAWLIQNWRSSGFGEVDFAEVMRQLNVPAATLDEFIQHFEGLDPEAQGELWKRFYDDLRRMEKDRHEQRMTALKDEQDATKKGYDDQIEGIRDAREAAQKAGVENLDAYELQIEALETQRDTAVEGIEARRRAEEERNDAVERALEEQDRLIKRQQEDYEDGLKRAAALEKERDELRKAYHKALQDEHKENEEIEKDAHDLTLEMLADLKQAQEEQHDARLELLDEEKRREDEMHKARLAQLDDELRRERAHLDGLEDQMAELKIEMAELKLDTGPLEAAKSLLDQIKDVIGDLDDARRNRAGQVQLDDGARAALETALATGRLSEAGARRAQRVLGGAALGAAQMRALLEEVAGLLTGSVKQEETVLDAKQRELDMLQIQIDKEKLRFDRAADAIKDQQDAEKARHDARMDAIADQIDAEKRAWDAFVDRLDAAKRAEDERHDAKMRQIEAEFRARLIAEGLIEEAGRDPEAALERARQIAEEIFGRLSQLVNGPGAAVTPPPTLVPPGPPGGPAPILPPGGPGLPPGPSPYSDGTGDDGLTPFGRFATAMQAYQQGQVASAIPVIIAGVEQAASSNALLGGVNFTYNQYAPNQVFDATDAPAEWIDALYGVVGLRSAP